MLAIQTGLLTELNKGKKNVFQAVFRMKTTLNLKLEPSIRLTRCFQLTHLSALDDCCTLIKEPLLNI